jgi:glycosyltransferase involved in cell wall biosynthesis
MTAATPLRVLVLTKRQYTARDLLDDRFGRLRELPLELATAGAQVAGVCLSYRPRPEGVVHDERGAGRVAWTSLSPRRLLPFGRHSYWATLDRIGQALRPDVVWACSDVPHAVLGVRVARRLGARLVIDLYDNFASFGLARVPGVDAALGRALRAADGVTCVSAPLARHVGDAYGVRAPVAVIENAIPAGQFVPGDRAAARAALGLPAAARLVGTAGALSHGRGIGTLFAAFERLAAEDPTVRLVLAGALERDVVLPASDRVHYLGLLPATDVPRLLTALDVSVVCNRDSAFGRYCFPQKLYESLACRVPVVVARVGAMAELLAATPQVFYTPDDAASLLAALRGQLAAPRVLDLPVPTWATLAARLGEFLTQVAAAPSAHVPR